MSEPKRRASNREFKLAVVERMMPGGKRGCAVPRGRGSGQPSSQVVRTFPADGPDTLRPGYRPGLGASDLDREDLVRARKRISELEREVGQQRVEVDF